MNITLTHRPRIAMLALLAVLAALAVASAATTASAAPASTSADRQLLQSGDARQAAAAEIPTLTNSVGQPGGGAEPQRPLGVGLLAVGLLGLIYALSLQRTATADRDPARRAGHARASAHQSP